MLELFEDKDGGGFYMTAHDAQPLIARPKETYDGAMPSGNSTAAMALERLAELTGEPLFREAAGRQLKFLVGQLKDYPAGYSYALLAMSGILYPHRELLCTGSRVPDEVISHIRTNPAHNLSILYKSKATPHKRRCNAKQTQLGSIVAGRRSDVCRRQAKSGQQAALVRQIEVCQSKHHI